MKDSTFEKLIKWFLGIVAGGVIISAIMTLLFWGLIGWLGYEVVTHLLGL